MVTNASGQVSEWQDQSGNANDAFQANADYQPLLVYPSEIGGRAAVRFDGNPGHINYLSGTGNVGVSNAMTSFVVVNEFSTTLYQNMVWLIGVPGNCLWRQSVRRRLHRPADFHHLGLWLRRAFRPAHQHLSDLDRPDQYQLDDA